MSYSLTEDQELIRQAAAEFAQEYLEPAAVKLDETGAYPAGIVSQMAEHDLFGLFLPEDVGGAAAGYLSYILVVEALAGVSAAVSSILVNHASLACYPITTWGSGAQKQQYLPKMATGTLLGGFALAEDGPAPGVGQHALVATKTAGGFSLTGTKPLVANAGAAGVYVVFATMADAPGTLTAFLVDATTSGLVVGPAIQNMGLRGRPTADLVFTNAVIPGSQVLGSPGGADAIARQTLAVASVAEAAETLGVAQAAVVIAAKYARQRIEFKQPIERFQAIDSMLAETATNCHLARLAIYDAAALIDAGKPFATEAAIVKAFASRMGFQSLIGAVEVEGGYGYSEAMPLARLFRDIPGTALRDGPGDYPEQLIEAGIR
jgi:acyl-CoA dehydrogenase